jgi:acetylornithine deacetylase/succinyl-diaminopimelate desuccinylase-like protein
MIGVGRVSAFSRVTRLATQRRVHEAFQWLHLHERHIMDWQAELVAIPAPPFQEAARAQWLLERFRQFGLQDAEIDPSGNVLAYHPPSSPVAGDDSPCILLSAHIDTIFPAGTAIHPEQKHTRLQAPGACDNGAGVAGLLAIAATLQLFDTKNGTFPLECGILFAGNVGEEGDGNLRGIRYLFEQSPWRRRIAANLVLDGAGHEIAVTHALGSRRFLLTITAPGGHSWTDAGLPNPIVLLSAIISRISEVKLSDSPRTTVNVGTIAGGTAVNAIPQSASARFDFRSTDPAEIIRLEVELHRAAEDIVLAANRAFKPLPRSTDRSSSKPVVGFCIEKIGDRPAAALPENANILELLRAVDRHLGIRTELRTASTDANIPLSLGVEALSIGAGGNGGGIHTDGEWYDSRDRETGLRRVLLLLLALAESAPLLNQNPGE